MSTSYRTKETTFLFWPRRRQRQWGQFRSVSLPAELKSMLQALNTVRPSNSWFFTWLNTWPGQLLWPYPVWWPPCFSSLSSPPIQSSSSSPSALASSQVKNTVLFLKFFPRHFFGGGGVVESCFIYCVAQCRGQLLVYHPPTHLPNGFYFKHKQI